MDRKVRASFGQQFATTLEAARVGADWALDRIYRTLAPAVTAYLRLGGAEDPEDLTSEVFLGAFRGLGRFAGGEEDLRTWVFGIAHARLVDERRQMARRVPTTTSEGLDWPASAGPDVEAEAMAQLGLEELRSLCGCLAPDQSDVLLLRLAGDLSLEQVARALGKSAGAVKSLQHRGLDALRRELARRNMRTAVSR